DSAADHWVHCPRREKPKLPSSSRRGARRAGWSLTDHPVASRHPSCFRRGVLAMENTFRLFPVQASAFAERLDRLYLFLVAVSGFFSALIVILIIFFAVKYRRRPGREADNTTHQSIGLELLWTAIPLMLDRKSVV